MKLKATTTVTQEVDVEIPYFFKKTDSDSYHAILEDKTVRVYRDSISVTDFPTTLFVGEPDSIQITEKEFAEQFEITIQKLQSWQ